MYRLAPLLLLAGATACGPDPLTCAELEREADGGMIVCDPLYPPTYENAWNNTFSVSCGKDECHGGARPRGGMDLSDFDAGYGELLEAGEDRIIPGDPECSELVARIYTKDSDWHMPPGDEVDILDTERCAIAKWVEAGAPR